MPITTLTFDLFGTILDLGSSLKPHIARMLADQAADLTTDDFWDLQRARQRLEQFQDSLMLQGHGGYLETVRRAYIYTLRRCGLAPGARDSGLVDAFMAQWQNLRPFPDVLPALNTLAPDFRLVVLSNGDPEFLDHLVTHQVPWAFDDVISVSAVGMFKPHPAVYQYAARRLGVSRQDICMVSANSFDVVGAVACEFAGAYVNRYDLPYEETPFRPVIQVPDFSVLSPALHRQNAQQGGGGRPA